MIAALRPFRRLLFVAAAFAWVGPVLAGPLSPWAAADEPAASPQEVFERRIVPIFKSPNPSSCTECHLAGVDLKHYILPSHEKTFLSLRDQGLIDLERPEQSKILKLINMRDTNMRDTKQGRGKGRHTKARAEGGRALEAAGASLVHEKTRRAEYEAFAEWIKASAADPKLRAAPKLAAEDLAQPPRPAEVIRHARKDRLLESFEQNIWAMRFRCMSCHIEETEQNRKLVAEYGQRVAWMKAAGPEATMRYVLGAKGLVNTKEPDQSLLLRKPLMEVEHGGGKKFLYGDQGYKAFRAWIEDYAKIVGDQYARAADLPKPTGDAKLFGSEIWLKLTGTPGAWGDKLLQVNIHAWDARAGKWEPRPIATSDRQVAAKLRLWQHTLTLAAPRDSELAKRWQREKPALPPGKYLVKVYVDLKGRAAKDWQAVLGGEEFVGQAEVTSRWPEGYGSMTVLEAGRLKR